MHKAISFYVAAPSLRAKPRELSGGIKFRLKIAPRIKSEYPRNPYYCRFLFAAYPRGRANERPGDIAPAARRRPSLIIGTRDCLTASLLFLVRRAHLSSPAVRPDRRSEADNELRETRSCTVPSLKRSPWKEAAVRPLLLLLRANHKLSATRACAATSDFCVASGSHAICVCVYRRTCTPPRINTALAFTPK